MIAWIIEWWSAVQGTMTKLTDWLAVYGAIAGTIALLLNYKRFLYTKNRDKEKLKISIKPHPNREINLKHIYESEGQGHFDRTNMMVKVFVITVRNLKNIDTYIEEASILTKDGKKVSALVSEGGGHTMSKISSSYQGKKKIDANSHESFNVYHRRGDEEFHPKYVEVLDSQGKIWKEKAK